MMVGECKILEICKVTYGTLKLVSYWVQINIKESLEIW